MNSPLKYIKTIHGFGYKLDIEPILIGEVNKVRKKSKSLTVPPVLLAFLFIGCVIGW